MQGFTGARDVFDLKVPAVVSNPVLAPELFHDFEDFAEAGEALGFGDAKTVELEVAPTQGRGENELAAADDIEGGNLLGGLHGMVEGEESDDTQFQTVGLGGGPGE